MRVTALAWCIALLVGAPVRAIGQESLVAAQQLYASAEYHNALAMLGALLAANPSPQERQEIELYRIFCLFAVNDTESAASALEALILRDPLYRPSAEVVPRRLRPSFSDARRRLLPAIIQEKYVLAKAAFDRGEYKDAAAGFRQTLMVLSDPDIATEAGVPPLSDLRVLASGFHELAVRALAPPVVPPPANVAPAPAAVAVPAKPVETRVYAIGDPGVTPPVTLRQDLPPVPRGIVSGRTGQLDVVIDETGAVEAATVVTAIDPRYSPIVLAAAKRWLYRPATVGGVPVKFRKRIQMELSPER